MTLQICLHTQFKYQFAADQIPENGIWFILPSESRTSWSLFISVAAAFVSLAVIVS